MVIDLITMSSCIEIYFIFIFLYNYAQNNYDYGLMKTKKKKQPIRIPSSIIVYVLSCKLTVDTSDNHGRRSYFLKQYIII